MGLMLSLLVTCVGVLEALACWRHFRSGYLPFPVGGSADGDGKCVAGSSSSSSDDSGSVKSLGAYYCSDDSLSKYGLTPMLSEHRRKQPKIRNEDDDVGGGGGSGDGSGGCGSEGHCSDVGGCEQLLLDTLPTIKELAQEPEEEQEEIAIVNGELDHSLAELQLQENHFSADPTTHTADKDSKSGAPGSDHQTRDVLDENDNISSNFSVSERNLCEKGGERESSPRPWSQLHFKAPTGDEDAKPQEFTTVKSQPTGTVDLTVEEIRSAVSKPNAVESFGTIPTVAAKSEVSEASLKLTGVAEQAYEDTTFGDTASSVESEDQMGNGKDAERNAQEEEGDREVQRASRASLPWGKDDTLLHKGSPSSSPHHSPQRSPAAKKLPKNVDISWPSFTPQPLFSRSSAASSTGSSTYLWPPALDRRRASSGDVSSDVECTPEGEVLRSRSLGPGSTEPAESYSDCADPWHCSVTKDDEKSEEPDDDAGRLQAFTEAQDQEKRRSRFSSSTLEDSEPAKDYERDRFEKCSLESGSENGGCEALKQDIPFSDTPTENNYSLTESKSTQPQRMCERQHDTVAVEKTSKTSATSVAHRPYETNSEQESSPEVTEDAFEARETSQHEPQKKYADAQKLPACSEKNTEAKQVVAENEEEEEEEEEVTDEPHVREQEEEFALEKNEPRKKRRRPVKISSFENEDSGKAQRKSHRSKATEQWSDEESDDRSAVSQSDCSSGSQAPGAGEPFWLIFSGEYTKAMSKDWHSGHFSCWQCDESLTGQRYVLRDDHPYCIKCYESVFANVCEECNKIIGIDSKDLSYKEKHWHEACFLCNKCRVSLVDKQFGSKGEKIYCGNCYDAQFASRCDGCGEIFRAGTKKMEYKTRQWHEKCFCCCVCKTPIGTKSFIPREQEIYCAGCYEEKFATRCVKCNKIITSGGVTYKNEPWHRECFTCTNCNTSLAGQRFTSRDEKPYCADCFGELFAKRCTSCSKPITGIGGTRFISFEDRHWHNDCFICAMCKTSLVGRGFITDADDIICPDCAKQKLM